MKLILTISLLLAVCLWQGCDTQQITDTQLTIIIDHTDSMRNYPTAERILQPLDIQHNKWSGFNITLTSISDKDVNDRIVVELPQQSEWSGNIVDRGVQIQHFNAQVQVALDTIRRAPTCAHSIVYRTIAREANSLAAAHATNKYLLVYSNLYENNGDLNFYRPSFIRELKQAPDKLGQRMVKSMPIDSMAHVQLWLLYTPISFTDNNRFMPVAALYKRLFEAHGATVHIATTFSQL